MTRFRLVVKSSLTFVFGTALLLTLLQTRPSVAADQSVLFVGNSYTFGNQPNSLQDIAGRLMEEGVLAWKTVFTRQISHGGYRWEQHSQDAQGKGSNQELHDLLVQSQQPDHKWNAVVLQESFWKRSLQALQTMDKLIAARGAHTVLLMTWGYHKGDSRNPGFFGSYKAMQQRLAQGYREFAKRASSKDRAIFVAPAGRAWEKIYDDLKNTGVDPVKEGTLFSRLYEGDGSHPSLLGSYLAGAVVYATLTGRDPSGLTSNPDNKIAPADLKALQQAAAWAVLEKDAGVHPYPWQKSWNLWKNPTNLSEKLPGLTISSVSIRPLVQLKTGTQKAVGLSLGATHTLGDDTKPGAGRLWISGIAELTVEGKLVVGAGGEGWLRVSNGFVTAEHVTLAQGPDSRGKLELLGGTLRTGTLQKGAGNGQFLMRGGTLAVTDLKLPLSQAGGTLKPFKETLAIQGDYKQLSSATLELKAPSSASTTPLLQVNGKAELKGTLKLTGDWSKVSGKVTLIQARELQVDPNFKIDGVDPKGIQTDTDKDGNKIYTFQVVIPGREKSKEEPVSDAGNSDDTTTPDVTPQDHYINTEGSISDSKEDDGCCQITDTPPAMMWFGSILFLLMWGGRRRRRS